MPADGYYERLRVGTQKIPQYITRADGEPLVFAGLWETWHRGEGDQIERFTIPTTEADEEIRHRHERRPVSLEPGNFADWHDPAKTTAVRAYIARPGHARQYSLPVG